MSGSERADEIVESVFDVVTATAPEIRASLPGRRVESGASNPSGETVMAADVYADELLEARISAIDGVGWYASEERTDVVDVGSDSGYGVAVDPLDGSSNLRSNNVMGTVLGVYDGALPAAGRDLIAAGYVLYGPITTMIVATDDGVREEVITRSEDESATDRTGSSSIDRPEADRMGVDRTIVDESITIPDDPTVYGFGGRVPDWTDGFREYARRIESELKLRYGGAMVGDVNQVLTYGGIFAYPALRDAPNGKLRLQFEANPIAFIIERAGGAASDGSRRILDVEPDDLHQRIPLHVGNESLIERLETALSGESEGGE
ncbi:class 1 fructose-bisphosphatase [Halopenitus sp. H-Gu1]|uniref:class 1 fructose-bisphosphatase n=1 Tax=Halopenitus sp. H-Gu1 TaxID=3242697 RepID=UPI00359CBBB6